MFQTCFDPKKELIHFWQTLTKLDRKTERQKDRETERQKDRKTERQKDKIIQCSIKPFLSINKFKGI